MRKPIFLILLLVSVITTISCSEPNLSFADLNPLFLGAFPHREININLIKGKVFHQFSEEYDLDQNGRRSYGDTYTPTFNHNYYFFDSNGRISRWLKEMIQNNQVISSIDSLYSYNRDDIHVNVTKYLVGYQPIVSEYSIASNKQNETIKFESKIISGINLDGPGFSFYNKLIDGNKVISDNPGGNQLGRVENVFSVEDNTWIVNDYKKDVLYSKKTYTFNGILLSYILYAKFEIVHMYSVAEGEGSMQVFHDGVLISDSVLERRLNPAGFLEFEQITKKDGGVSTYRAEIIDAKE